MLTNTKQESRREVAERIVGDHARQWVVVAEPRLIEAIEAALKDRDERAAKIADKKADEWGALSDKYYREGDKYNANVRQGWTAGAQAIAAAIRNEDTK